MWKFTTRKPLDSGDDKDTLIELDKELLMCYSFRAESADFEKHDSVGRFTLTFQSDG